MTELLIDTMPLVVSLEEAEGRPGKYIFRGQFARSDKATDNKRLYREHLWRREFKRLSESMARRGVYGELDHPSDGRTKLARVSHLITKLDIKGNEVIGEAEILDTPNGRIMKALADAKASVGVSSRGYGSIKTIAGGVQEVQEDFKLDTFDFVADPATKTAYPELFREEREHIREAEVELTLEILKRDYPGLMEQVSNLASGDIAQLITEAENRTEARLREDWEHQLRRSMEVLRDEAVEQARSELLSDPQVAAAKQICERIFGMVKSFGVDPEAHLEIMGGGSDVASLETKLADRELEVQAAKRETEEMAALARKSSYMLHLERSLRGDPSAEAIIALVGDPSLLASTEEIDERVEAIRDELEKRGGPVNTQSDTQAALEAADARAEQAEETADSLKKQLRESRSEETKAKRHANQAIQLAEAAQLQIYVEQKIGGNPQASALREECEGATSEKAIDEIVERFVPHRTHDPDEADRIRARVESGARGKQRDLLEDTYGDKKPNGGKPSNGAGNPLEEFGLTGDRFDKLSGSKS